MRWGRILSATALCVLTVATTPAGAQPAPDNDSEARAPSLSLATLGSSSSMSFYGQASEQTITLPVQTGLVDRAHRKSSGVLAEIPHL